MKVTLTKPQRVQPPDGGEPFLLPAGDYDLPDDVAFDVLRLDGYEPGDVAARKAFDAHLNPPTKPTRRVKKKTPAKETDQ